MSLVSCCRVESSDVKRAIENALDLIDYKFQENIKKVVIKPNMCYYWDYSTGQTTDPKFVAAIIDVLRGRISPNPDISIVESDASAMKCRHAFKMLGYENLAVHKDVRLTNLSDDKGQSLEVSVNGQLLRFTVPAVIQTADLRINLPKIKYMAQTKISGALKNIFGCNPYPDKFKYHSRLDETIVALNKIMKFNLCILDGIFVPGSPPRRLNLVMSSRDPVALDAAAARLAGVNPRSVKHITLAEKEGLGTVRFTPLGTDIKHFEKMYPRKKLTAKVMSSLYVLATRSGLLKRDAL